MPLLCLSDSGRPVIGPAQFNTGRRRANSVVIRPSDGRAVPLGALHLNVRASEKQIILHTFQVAENGSGRVDAILLEQFHDQPDGPISSGEVFVDEFNDARVHVPPN